MNLKKELFAPIGRGIFAKAGLEIKAIKLRPEKPFVWSSGFQMPIYVDNRMLLFCPELRELIKNGFRDLLRLEEINYDIIAGTSTAGIPWGALLANEFQSPFIYVRDKSKAHGLKNRIEGIDAEKNLEGYVVILVEDLISTGESSVRAVQAIRDANGVCNHCISIFDYGFDKAKKMFKGEIPYDKEDHKLVIPCDKNSLLTYDILLKVAKETGYIDDQQAEMLEEWRADPFGWGEKHGFPKVEK